MRRAAATFALALVASLALGCNPEQLAANPLGPCGDDARTAGGYPELEALLPVGLFPGLTPPNRVDSGRSCSDVALGTLKAHGVTELRFAGATWNDGDNDGGTVVAVFATPNWVPLLEEAWVEEFYEAGARAGKKTDNIETSRPTYEGAGEVFRIDTLNDLSLQSIVVWQTAGLMHVVIVATDVTPLADRATHDQRVEIAVAAGAGAPGIPSPGPGCGCTTGPTPSPAF